MSESNQPEKVNVEAKESQKKRTRKIVPYPLCPVQECFKLAASIYELGMGHKVRRVTLFDQINRSPDSGPSRTLISNTNKYGLIKGGYQAEYLELTAAGIALFSESSDAISKIKAKIEIAILNVEPLNQLYQKFVGNKLPAKSVLADILKENEVLDSSIDTLVDIFIVNAEFCGALQTLSGAARLVSIEHIIESQISSEVKSFTSSKVIQPPGIQDSSLTQEISSVVTSGNSNFDTTCFYITPIGAEDSEHRKHSDLLLGSIVEPAIEPLGLKLVRADSIDKPGLITNQIIEYILRSKLVIVDLSFHNPNVFYELALRHVSRLPVIQIVRKGDNIPFDVGNFRTIILDFTSIYTLVPKLETYKSDIRSQARTVLEDPGIVENPVISVYPNLKLSLGQ